MDNVYEIFKNFNRDEAKLKDWNAYGDYLPEKVMDSFNNIFIKPLL